MKKIVKNLVVIMCMLMLVSLAACMDGQISESTSENPKYTVTFNSNGGSEVAPQTLDKGTFATAPSNPTKDATASTVYTFEYWYLEEGVPFDFAATAINSDVELKAKWDEATRKYTVKFVNANGAELQSSEVEYGAVPEYVGEDPTMDADAQYTYTFAGWNADVVAVTGEVTYTAVYTTVTNKYVVKFVNADGAELQSSEVEYGVVPEYEGEIPTKVGDAQYSYTFAGWDAEVVAVTGEVTYTAVYTPLTNKYVVKFVNADGTELQSSEVEYGTVPAYTGATPVKVGNAQYSYAFDGWDAEVVAVTGEVTYTAVYTPVTNKYVVKFVNADGTELQNSEVEYGVVPAYTGETPVKAADAQYTYTFTGWDTEVVAVTGEVTYTATYTETIRQYTVTVTGGEANVETADYGTEVTLTVTEEEGKIFLAWIVNGAVIEGNTFELVEDTTVIAYFVSESGVMFDFSENVDAVTGSWIGSYSHSTDVQFNGQNTLRIEDNTDNMIGFGVFLDNTMLAQLLSLEGYEGVKLSFDYYLHDYEWNCNVIEFGGIKQSVTKDAWTSVSFVFTAMPENFIIGSNSNGWGTSAKGYLCISNITYELVKPLPTSGVMFDFSENVNAVANSWIGSYSHSTDVQYNGQNTLKIEDNSDNMIAFGVFLDKEMLAQLLAVEGYDGVRLTLNYYLHDYEWNCNYIELGGIKQATTKDAWTTVSFVLTEVPENFILCITSGSYGTSAKGYLCISNVSYELVEPMPTSGVMFDFSENIGAVTNGWVGSNSWAQYDGQNVLKLEDNSDNMLAFGAFLDKEMLAQLLAVEGYTGVRLTLTYYLTDYEWNCNYIELGGVKQTTTKDAWTTVSFDITEVPDNFILCITSGGWGTSAKGCVYIGNITYELV